jgi:hypothetical protein
MYSPVEHGRERDQITLMKLITNEQVRSMHCLGHRQAIAIWPIETPADSALVYFLLAFMKAMDSCKLDFFAVSQSLLSIFDLILQFQARPRSSYNISFQLHVFVFPLLQHPARSKRFFLFAGTVL